MIGSQRLFVCCATAGQCLDHVLVSSNVQLQSCTTFHSTAHLSCLKTVISVKINGWYILSLDEQAKSIKLNAYNELKCAGVGEKDRIKHLLHENSGKICLEQTFAIEIPTSFDEQFLTPRKGFLVPNQTFLSMILSNQSTRSYQESIQRESKAKTTNDPETKSLQPRAENQKRLTNGGTSEQRRGLTLNR